MQSTLMQHHQVVLLEYYPVAIVIELNHEKDGEIGFASLSRMGIAKQKVSFIIYNANWLQDSSKKFLENGANIFRFFKIWLTHQMDKWYVCLCIF